MSRSSMGAALLLLSGPPLSVMGQNPPFLETLKASRQVSPQCVAAVSKIPRMSDTAKQLEIFSGRPMDALQIMVPEIMKDIKGDQNEARGIGKYLYRPQIWSRGAADSCFYLGDEFQFCNIDMFKRRSSWGVCIPRECTSNDVKHAVFPSPMFDQLTVEWVEVTCSLPEMARGHATAGTWVCVAVLLALGLFEAFCMWLLKKPDCEGRELPRFGTAAPAVFMRSLHDARERAQTFIEQHSDKFSWSKLLACFSLAESWKALTEPPRPGQFLCLDAIRTISFLWIVLGHVMYFLGQGVNWTNHREAYGFYGKGFLGTLPGLLTVGFYFAVDSFLFMSAFLAILSCFRTLTVKKVDTLTYIKSIPKEYARRWLRLTPAYAVAIWTMIYIAPAMIDGTRRAQFMWFCTNCRHRWWENMLYINNIVSDQPMPMCFPIGWFLGLLFQLQLLGPWIGIVAVRQPKMTIVGLLALCVASWSYSAYITDARDFRLNPMDTKHGYDHWSNEWYTKPWTRAPSYLIGSMYGIMWQFYGKDIQARLDKSKGVQAGLLALSLLLLGFAIIGPVRERPNVPGVWTMLERQLYISMSSSSWAVGFGGLLTLLFTGPTFGIRALLEMSVWTVYGRLSYCLYLLHATVLGIITASQGDPWHFTLFVFITIFFGVASVTVIAALPLYLLVERPFNALSELLLRDGVGAAKKLDATPAPTTQRPLVPEAPVAKGPPLTLADVELRPFEETKMEAR